MAAGNKTGLKSGEMTNKAENSDLIKESEANEIPSAIGTKTILQNGRAHFDGILQ